MEIWNQQNVVHTCGHRQKMERTAIDMLKTLNYSFYEKL